MRREKWIAFFLRDGRTVDLAKGGDVLVRVWVLAAKLVAREPDDGQTLVLVLLVRRLETLELGREATLRGRVDDEDDLALQLAQVVGRLFKLGLETCQLPPGQLGPVSGFAHLEVVYGGRGRHPRKVSPEDDGRVSRVYCERTEALVLFQCPKCTKKWPWCVEAVDGVGARTLARASGRGRKSRRMLPHVSGAYY